MRTRGLQRDPWWGAVLDSTHDWSLELADSDEAEIIGVAPWERPMHAVTILSVGPPTPYAMGDWIDSFIEQLTGGGTSDRS